MLQKLELSRVGNISSGEKSENQSLEFQCNIQSDSFTKDDILSITLLLLLYTIQGFPMGLRAAIPLVIYKRVSYSQMGFLSLTAMPFCLKLLWAPILDSIYIKRLGKRKTWLIPTQILCSVFLLYGGLDGRIDRWAGEDGSPVDVPSLFIFFMILYILMATQDIAVDGWALTMLRPSIRMHASTCNAAGQAFGINLAYIGFITLNNRGTCFRIYRAWGFFSSLVGILREPLGESTAEDFPPFVTLSGFSRFLGIVIVICTVCVILKTELEEKPTMLELSIISTSNLNIENGTKNTEVAFNNIFISYSILKKILGLKPIRLLAFILLTKTFFFAPEYATELKLLEKGLPKDILAMVTLLTIPIEVVGPAIISLFMQNIGAMRTMFRGLCLRLFAMTLSVAFVGIAGAYYADTVVNNAAKTFFYISFFTIALFHRACGLIVFVSDMAIFAKASDPTVGGTYMTLLNTLANLGALWPGFIGLSLIDILSKAKIFSVDPLYVECTLCLTSAFVLLPFYGGLLKQIEAYDPRDWYVQKLLYE